MDRFQKEFDDYVCNFDLNDEKIKLKYNHSYRVMSLCRKYSKLLNFNDYDIKLATLIGLLHDIGRFEQLKKYNTYDDSKSINHAEYGCKILFEDGLISKFWDNKDDYDLIRFAIFNHNRFKIEETNSERFLKFAKLIRDTDKIDILYLESISGNLESRLTDDSIAPEIRNDFFKHDSVLLKHKKSINDHFILYFAYAYDINYDECLDEIKLNIENLYNNFNDKKFIFKEYYDEIIKYISERIDKNVRK